MNLISMWQDPGNGHAFYQCQHHITKYHLLGAGLSDLLLTERLFSLSKLCDYKEGRRGSVGMGGVIRHLPCRPLPTVTLVCAVTRGLTL